ncbi:GntR family transcriptional regulator [Oceanobacillus saliphilus]|uniref:GntR family transcriptional regulator n=1 Tax=Oceanobacillus saliphilus TaxID=2925834 RepID=UPI00201DCAEF
MESFNFSSLMEGKNYSLPEQIANYILSKIFIGEVQQGKRLIESEIAKELNVSNIPVREAFYILQNTGIIERLPRKGVRVKSITEQEMSDYTDALIELFRLGVDYSASKWDDEKRNHLKQYLKEANEMLLENNILQYVVKVHRLCGYIFDVAENKAFIKFYSDITFITNAYSQMMWGEVDKTKERYMHLEALVDALVHSNFEQAKEAFEILTRQSLSLKMP